MSSSRRGRRPYTTLVTATRGGTRPRLSIAAALGAAALFGLSVPAGKTLLAVTDPWLLAGLLYLGSGVSLSAYRLAQRFLLGRHGSEARLGRTDWPWLAAAIVTGGVIAPVLLMFGLSRAAAAEAALMLNLEGVFTAIVAWVVFRKHAGTRRSAWIRQLWRQSCPVRASPPRSRRGKDQRVFLDRAIRRCAHWRLPAR